MFIMRSIVNARYPFIGISNVFIICFFIVNDESRVMLLIISIPYVSGLIQHKTCNHLGMKDKGASAVLVNNVGKFKKRLVSAMNSICPGNIKAL